MSAEWDMLTAIYAGSMVGSVGLLVALSFFLPRMLKL